MSDAVSALNGRVSSGDVTVKELGLRGMIVLRGDLTNKELRAVCIKLTDVAFPVQGQATSKGDSGLAWMTPDEILVMVPHGQTAEAIVAIDKALKGQHYLAENVSDARAVICVKGAYPREVIAKLAPVDLSPKTFEVGAFRRTRLGEVAAAFWMRDEHTFEVICFRSVAEYAFNLLEASAKAGPVGHF